MLVSQAISIRYPFSMRFFLLFPLSFGCIFLTSCGGETPPPPGQSTLSPNTASPTPEVSAAPAVVEKAATTEDGMDALEALEAEVQ